MFVRLGKLGSLTLMKQPVLEKENSEFRHVVYKIDFMSHPTRDRGCKCIHVHPRRHTVTHRHKHKYIIYIYIYIYIYMNHD